MIGYHRVKSPITEAITFHYGIEITIWVNSSIYHYKEAIQQFLLNNMIMVMNTVICISVPIKNVIVFSITLSDCGHFKVSLHSQAHVE